MIPIVKYKSINIKSHTDIKSFVSAYTFSDKNTSILIVLYSDIIACTVQEGDFISQSELKNTCESLARELINEYPNLSEVVIMKYSDSKLKQVDAQFGYKFVYNISSLTEGLITVDDVIRYKNTLNNNDIPSTQDIIKNIISKIQL